MRCGGDPHLARQHRTQLLQSVAISSGTGKSHLAEALAHAAVEKDLRVAWFTLETLTAAIGKAKADGSVARTVTRICRSDLVVVDLCRHRNYAEAAQDIAGARSCRQAGHRHSPVSCRTRFVPD